MLKNFTTEDDLKAYVPNLTGLLWAGETDYTAQIAAADKEVRNDFTARGLRHIFLRPDLVLIDGTESIAASETSDAIEEAFNYGRLAVEVTAFSGANKTLTLEGSNDNSTWETIYTVTISETGNDYYDLPAAYAYYRTNLATSSGAVTAKVYLTETSFDTLFVYKTLELILQSFVKNEGDQFSIKRDYFAREYREKLSSLKSLYDVDLSGTVDTGETNETTSITYYR